jgi:hypothetical protein
VDPARQVTLEQVHGEAPRILKSHIEVGESSRAKPRVTTRILLNKWQRQLEKERYQKRRHEEERRRTEEEACRKELDQYTREHERAHWGCAFFRHCWNEGLKLPTLRNCPECSDRYFEYRQVTVNRRSVHERIGRIHPSDDRRQKIIEIIDHPRKRQTGWLKALQAIEKIKKCLPWRRVLSRGISRRMIGEKKSWIICRIHPEKLLGSSGIKPLNLFFWMEVYSINHWMGYCSGAWVQKKQRRS